MAQELTGTVTMWIKGIKSDDKSSDLMSNLTTFHSL